MKAYHGQAWWWGMAVLLTLMMSGCGYTVATVVDEPAPVYYRVWWPYWYGHHYPGGYYPGYRIYPRQPHSHVVVPKAPLKVHPAPQQHRESGNHR